MLFQTVVWGFRAPQINKHTLVWNRIGRSEVVAAIAETWKRLCDRARRWVLSGKMTLLEAAYLHEHPDLTEEGVRRCMELRHGRHHRQFIQREPSLRRVLKDFSELSSELQDMPPTVRAAFGMGKLTLIQARHAINVGLKGDALTEFLEINPPLNQTPWQELRVFERVYAGAIHDEYRMTQIAVLIQSGMLNQDEAEMFQRAGTPIEGIRMYAATRSSPELRAVSVSAAAHASASA